MNIKPLADRVVIKMLEAEETTKGGIILTSLSNFVLFLFYNCENLALTEDSVLYPVNLYFRSRVLADKYLIAYLNFHLHLFNILLILYKKI